MERKLSKYLADFRAKHNTQHTLLKMINTWCAILNKDNKVMATITDLTEAIDTLNQNVFLCKLKAYGFNKNVLTFT